MHLANLTPVVAPLLIFSSSSSHDDGREVIATRAQDVFTDLVTEYVRLFDVTPEELAKERQIQRSLILLRETKVLAKPAGDMLVGVYVGERECGPCLNVRLSPGMTAHDLVLYVIRSGKTPAAGGVAAADLSVFEVVCERQLERLVHWRDPVLPITLSWATDWPPEDAKGNFLLVKENKSLFQQIRPILSHPPSAGGINASSRSILRSPTATTATAAAAAAASAHQRPPATFQPFTLFSELRYSGPRGGKSFKKVLFEFVGAKMTAYKDAKAVKTIGEWNIESITWFMGSEKRRSAPTPYAFTFFDRNERIERSKESAGFVGHVVCCATQAEFLKWLAGMMVAEFPADLFPPQGDMIDLLS